MNIESSQFVKAGKSSIDEEAKCLQNIKLITNFVLILFFGVISN